MMHLPVGYISISGNVRSRDEALVIVVAFCKYNVRTPKTKNRKK